MGPIDPSTNGALNPVVPGTNQRVPVSVEFVNAYIEMAKNEFSIHDEKCMTDIFLKLSELILIAAEWMYHPYHFEMYQS